MVSGWPLTDTETGEEVVGDGKDGRLVLQLDPVRGDQADERDEDNEGRVEPVDVLVPVGPCYRLFCDVCGKRLSVCHAVMRWVVCD
jgi:hypothetical protein